LGAAGIEFAALKGLTHCSDFGSLPEDRTQYDIDLFIAPDQWSAHGTPVMALGYRVACKRWRAFPPTTFPR